MKKVTVPQVISALRTRSGKGTAHRPQFLALLCLLSTEENEPIRVDAAIHCVEDVPHQAISLLVQKNDVFKWDFDKIALYLENHYIH